MRSWPALALEGVDDLVEAALTDFDVAAVEELGERSCRVFFTTADGRREASRVLQQQFPALLVTPVDVPDEDWAARSQANLKAVRVGDLVVAPPWDTHHWTSSIEPCALIVIQPSMGFGTGHHATTRLCLSALQQMDLRGRRVVDVGTGSGVLAIAASLLGAAPVAGIDDDPDAIQAARENLGLNPQARVALDVVDLRTSSLPPADVVLANLTGGLLMSAAPSLTALAAPGGRLILSGFMDHEETDVRQAFGAFAAMARAQEDEWVCVTLESRP